MALPRNEAGILARLQLWSVKLPNLMATLGLTAADITRIQNDALVYAWAIEYANFIRKESEGVTAAKKILFKGSIHAPAPTFAGSITPPPLPATATIQPGIEEFLDLLATRIEGSTNYTEEIGRELGLITDSTDGGDDEKQPVVKKREALFGGHVRLTFSLQGMKAVWIMSKRGAETAFTKLDTAVEGEYVDTRPNLVAGQPEVREYQLVFLEKNQPVGQPSDIVSVTTNP